MDKRVSFTLYFTATLAIIAGFILSLISYLQVCAEACGKAHDYKLCGFSFECYGLIFFPVVGILHVTGFHRRIPRFITALLVALAFGAEIDFLLVQKYQIKSFCPICLGIAACIFIVAATYTISYLLDLKELILKNQKGEIMKSIRKALSTLSFVALGFLFAFVGIAKEDPLKAAESAIKDKIALGNLQSPVEVFIFSDWQCPACRSVEPNLEKIIPKIAGKARINFVDVVAHKETLNFIPYNVSFLTYDKQKYMELRKILTQISIKTKEPTEDQIRQAIGHLGVQYKQLNYADVSGATAYFDDLVKEHNIQATPIVVIVRDHKLPGTVLMGSEINEANILKAVESK